MSLIRLELDNTKALLTNLNTRTEKAGDEIVPAADLQIETFQSADILSEFSPTLKAHLFNPNSLDLAEGMALMHPELKTPLPLEGEMTGVSISIDYGVGVPIIITDCKVGKFKITPIEGGSVGLGFRIQCKPTEEQISKLYTLQRREINITVTPMELVEVEARDE